MKLIGNNRAKQTVAVQLVIFVFFTISAFNISNNGVEFSEISLLLVCALGIMLSTISIVGVSLYFLQYYLKLDEETIFCNGLSFRSRKISVKDIGGYTLDSGDNLTIRGKNAEALMEIHCCYLADEDRTILFNLVEKYGKKMILPRKKSLLSNLFKSAKV